MAQILGAVLAGGRSSRFGSDKAVALLDGRSLIERVTDALRPQVATIVVCGREHPAMVSIADRPGPDFGPLGGLNAALHYAAAHGFGAVVSVPCDTPLLPPDLVKHLQAAGGAAFVASIPVIGLWPVALADALDRHLATLTDWSIRRWALAQGAVVVEIDPVANVNTVADLAAIASRQAL